MNNSKDERFSYPDKSREEIQSRRSHLEIVPEDFLKSESPFSNLLDALPHVVWSANPDGAIAYFNQRWQEYT
ncbi:MAG TPA: PAS domain-containing protein, partial [Kamptonema sp.]|nr:PAS domain-containing protein [Kamptonema sp.]